MKIPAAILLLLFLPFLPALAQSPPGSPPGAQGPRGPDLSIPADTATKWVVGFSVFRTDGLSTENAYLAFSLPLLLKNQVSGLDSHTYTSEERDGARKAILSREQGAAAQAVTRTRKERDALLFGDSPPSAATRQAVDTRLDAALARRDFLQSLDASRVDVVAEKPVSFKEGTGAGKLLELQQYPAAAYCAREGIDLLVGGSIREVQGYLLLDVWAFDAARGAVVFSSREAAQGEELSTSLPSLGKGLTGTILGRDWALLVFAPDPPGASLFVDGTLVVSGASPALYLTPGTREIRISAPGHLDALRTMTLESGQETRLAETLQKEAKGAISVTSEPPSANLYLDSVWRGKTPILLETPSVRSRGMLSLAGYYDLSFSVGADAPAQLSFMLKPDFGAGDAEQKKARDEFYVSFAWFAASIPLPMFCYASYIDYALQGLDFQVRGWDTQAASAQVTSNAFLLGYYAGIAISASLFTWIVNRIIHYVAVSNGTAG